MAPSKPRAALLAAAIVVVPALEAQAPPTVQAGGIFFEPNLGQASPEVVFLARAGSSSVLLGTDGIVFRWRPEASPEPGPPRSRPSTVPEGRVRMTLVGGRLADPVAADRRGSITNYFLGPDRSRWLRGVPNYGRVVYRGVYAGVDLAFHAEQGHVEYDFIVAPGADPAAIELQFDGQTGVRLDGNGDLLLDTPAGQLRQPRPRAYHGDAAGERTDVAAEFVVQPGGRVGFRLGAVDQGRQLVIDPQVLWSTGTPTNGWKLAASPAGRTYVVGNSSQDLVLSGLDVAGQLAWTSYFGGARTERGWDVALGPDGSVYATGDTQSSDLPPPDGFTAGLPPGSPSGTAGGWARKVLLLRFDQSSGDLLFFTWFGGTAGLGVPGNQQMSLDRGSGLAVDPQGYVYVTGSTTSQGFPVQGAVIPGPNPNGVNTVSQGWAAKLDPSMSALVYSTYLRGSTEYEGTEPMDVAVDPWGNAHIAGLTDASDFIVSADALDTKNDAWDHSGFVTKLGPAGELIYSTYLGGADMDSASGVAMDAQGRACLTGRTLSTDFPRTAGPGLAGGEDTFATRLTVDGTALAYSRTIGGNGDDLGEAIMVGPDDDLFVVGRTYSTDWPTHGSVDQFVVRLSPSGIWQWTLALGGTGGDQAWGGAIDQRGHVYTSGTLLGAGGVVTQIDVCASGLISLCGPQLELLPTTTRWKPQRSDSPVEFRFVGPADLLPGSVVADLLLPAGGGSVSATGPVGTEPAGGDCLPAPGEACYVMTWLGPWTYAGPQGPGTRLPAGRYVVTLRGEAGSAPTRQVSSLQYSRFALVEVESVSFEPELGGAELGENPNAGGGKAAYVDAAVPGLDYRRNVRVVARVTPLMGADAEGLYVVHRWLEVDDPSAATAPIDDESHSSQQCSLPGGVIVAGACDNAGKQPAPLLGSPIDALGQSESVMTLSTRQGDNYRVVASTDNEWAMGFRPLPGPNADGAVEHGSGEPQGMVAPLVSPLLTVWRTLHIESDYLTPSEPQSLWDRTGNVQSVSPTKITADGPVLRDAEHAGKGKWQGAELTPDIGQPNTWLEATGSTDSTVTVSSANDLTTLTQPGKEFQISDDKWVDLSQRLPLDLARTLARQAYIDVRETTFNSVVAHGWVKYFGEDKASQLPRDVPSSPAYWAVTGVAAFDYGSAGNGEDNDPDLEDGHLGITTGTGGATNVAQPATAVYVETLRDVSVERAYQAPDRLARVAAHEILCHGMFLGHRSADICEAQYRDDPAGALFLADRVADLRQRQQPCICPGTPPDCVQYSCR